MKSTLKPLKFLLALCLFFAIANFSRIYAAEIPSHWPWKGVVMDEIGNAPEDIHELVRNLHINSVHLSIVPRRQSQLKNVSSEAAMKGSLDWLDKMLVACKQEKIVGIVELSDLPIDLKSDYETSPLFWASQKEKQDALSTINHLVDHLKNHGEELAAYNIISEPVMLLGGKALRPLGWESFQEQIVKSIRVLDSERWVIVKTGPWGLPDGYRDFSSLPYQRLIYSVDMFFPHAFTHQGIQNNPASATYPGEIQGTYFDSATLEKNLLPLIEFQQKNRVLVWVGSFSALRWAPGGEQYLQDLVNIFNRHGWGWSYFGFTEEWTGWNPNYDEFLPVPNETKAVAQSHKVGMKSKRWQALQVMFSK